MAVGEEESNRCQNLRAKYKNVSQGKLILVKEKSGKFALLKLWTPSKLFLRYLYTFVKKKKKKKKKKTLTYPLPIDNCTFKIHSKMYPIINTEISPFIHTYMILALYCLSSMHKADSLKLNPSRLPELFYT